MKSKLIQIISSHRISTIENTDKLIYLVKGKIKYFGKTKILLKKPDIKAFFNKRENMKIWLSDLTYTQQTISSDVVPGNRYACRVFRGINRFKKVGY